MSAYVRVVRSIWTDPEWLDLTSTEKLVYLQLISQPNISKCGVLPFVPGRWAHMHPDLDAAQMRAIIERLECKRYVIVDRDTEELLVRTYLRYDEAWKQTNGTRGIQIEATEIMSKHLLEAVIQEYEQASGNDWRKGSDKGCDNPCDKGSGKGNATPLSPNPDPLPLNPDPTTPDVQAPTDALPVAEQAEIVPLWETQFAEFWSIYPRKVNKKKALVAFRNLTNREREAALDAIVNHVAYWEESSTGDEFIPHPTSWLNGKRWEDELATPQPKGKTNAVVDHIQRRINEHRDGVQTGRSLGSGDTWI